MDVLGNVQAGGDTPMDLWVDPGEVVQVRFGRDSFLDEETAIQATFTVPADHC